MRLLGMMDIGTKEGLLLSVAILQEIADHLGRRSVWEVGRGWTEILVDD